MAFVSNDLKGIVSNQHAFLVSSFLGRFLISLSLTVLKENLSLSETLDPLTTCLIFCNAWMMIVRIENSNRLYAGVIKVCVKGF